MRLYFVSVHKPQHILAYLRSIFAIQISLVPQHIQHSNPAIKKNDSSDFNKRTHAAPSVNYRCTSDKSLCTLVFYFLPHISRTSSGTLVRTTPAAIGIITAPGPTLGSTAPFTNAAALPRETCAALRYNTPFAPKQVATWNVNAARLHVL